MKEQNVLQFAIVRETTAQAFEDTLNERLRELRVNNDAITFDSSNGAMIARIAYKVKCEIAEEDTPKAETGIRFTCGDCPCFQPQRNRDGSIDMRAKVGDCPHSKFMGRTTRDTAACEQLYTMIQNGGIKLCFSE